MIRIFISLLLFSGYATFSQNRYEDSLKIYQDKYKKELFEIIKSDTAYICFYPTDESLITTANVMVLNNEAGFKMTTSSGKTKDARKYAQLTFILSGKEYSLYAYQLLNLITSDSFHLFLPFTDETCGETSYGGGRYIDLDIRNIKDNKLIIDFNKAYNPYCAFTTGYNCPIPPRENTLPVPIKAGEQYRAGKFRH